MKEIYDYRNDDSNYRVVITDKTVYSEIKAESEKADIHVAAYAIKDYKNSGLLL